jgi:sugar lactone lactonase YvrE
MRDRVVSAVVGVCFFGCASSPPGTTAEPVGAAPAAPLARTITTVAGYDQGVPGPVAKVWMSSPRALHVTDAGDIYYADGGYLRIRRIEKGTLMVTEVAGSGIVDCPDVFGCSKPPGDEGLAATQAHFAGLGITGGNAIAMGAHGLLYIADTWNGRVAAVNTGGAATDVCGTTIAPGTIHTVVGPVDFPVDVVVDPLDGAVLFSELFGGVIVRIDPDDCSQTVIVGGGAPWYDCPVGTPPSGDCSKGASPNGDCGPALGAPLCSPEAMAFDSHGNLYFTEWTRIFSGLDAGDVRKVDRGGSASWDGAIITTYAGDGIAQSGGDGGPAILAGIAARPGNIVFDPDDNGFVSDSGNSLVRRVDAKTGIIETVVGNFTPFNAAFYSADEVPGPALASTLVGPDALFYHRPTGRLYVADNNIGVIRYVAPDTLDGRIKGRRTETIYEVGSIAGLKAPFAAAFDLADNLLVGDNVHPRVDRVDRAGNVTTVVNSADIRGNSGDGGRAADARTDLVLFALDELGNLYLSDGINQNVRRVDAVRAEDGRPEISGDSIIRFVTTTPFVPGGIAVHGQDIYLAELFGTRVWDYNLTRKTFTPLAGNGKFGYSGDDGLATDAELATVVGLAYDRARDALFLAELDNHLVREVDLRTNKISTLVHFPDQCVPFGFDCFGTPLFLTVAGDFLYVNDDSFGFVYRVDLAAAAPTLDPVAGFLVVDGPNGFSGDEVVGTASRLSAPEGVAVDSAGKLHFVEYGGSQRVRRLGVVDILPGQFPNRISLSATSDVEVAILGTYDFDPHSIDATSVTVAGAPIVGKVRYRDVDGDGRLDMVFTVRARDLQLSVGDREAAVVGLHRDRTPFQDADWVTVRP